MSTLILDKTLSLLSEVISRLQLEAEENDYWESEYENSVEDHYSRYGF
jgi:hypothetical protein